MLPRPKVIFPAPARHEKNGDRKGKFPQNRECMLIEIFEPVIKCQDGRFAWQGLLILDTRGHFLQRNNVIS